jgi:glycosyltransferase involved in cell wall biosynthesis
MKIAQVAPLVESVPPQLYGGTERVVAHLTDELVRQGHDVTLFASGDSQTSARLIAVCPRAQRLAGCVDTLAHHVLLVEEVARRLHEFDVIHFHISALQFPILRRAQASNLTTLHGRLDLPELVPLFREYSEMPVVSISHAQRAPLPHANWVGTVHHGYPLDLFKFQPRPGRYLAFLGRISPEKRVDRAIAIAKACGWPIRIAAKVDPVDSVYFRNEIAPLFEDPLVDYIGEIGEADKNNFLGNAAALLFPIDWPEPFGLVMIEALACGTPVVAFRAGSVPEVIDHGVTGFVVDDVDEAVAATRQIAQIDRAACRRVFEQRFSVTRMASEYVALYEGQIDQQSSAAVA